MDVESSLKSANGTAQLLALQLSKTSIHADEQEHDQQYGGYSDRSIEFAMLEQQCQDVKQIEQLKRENLIIEYLKSRGLRMKTDPKAKQDRYYLQIRRKQYKKAYTSIGEQFIHPESVLTMTPAPPKSTFNHLQMNSIILRRSPQVSTGSSPLIQMPPQINQSKSQFCTQQAPAQSTKIISKN